jgi:hypothetical protein
VQHLAQVAASAQHPPVQTWAAGLVQEPSFLQVEQQPVVISTPTATTAASIIIVFILFPLLFVVLRFAVTNSIHVCHWQIIHFLSAF